jgi:hypothetical protein
VIVNFFAYARPPPWPNIAVLFRNILIKKQHPNLDIRFVFTNSRSKLSKVSKSSYGQWCTKHGFKYHDRIIPEDWLKEKGRNKHPEFIEFTGKKIRSTK